jgi:hypothetical protein
MLNDEGIQNAQCIKSLFQNLEDGLKLLFTPSEQVEQLADSIQQLKTEAHIILMNDPSFQEE